MDLKNIRDDIDRIDRQLTALFEERMEIVLEVARFKKENNLPVYDKAREEAVIEKNKGYLNNPVYADGLAVFYHCLMDLSKDLQREALGTEDE